MTVGVVLAGGASHHQLVPPSLRDDGVGRVVVAADSGADLADRLGIGIDLLIGDLDSVSAAALDRARTAGSAIREYPADKDRTDLELALDAAVEAGATSLVVLGGAGGRFDHLLANVTIVAASARRLGVAPVEAWIGDAFVSVLDERIAPEWSASPAAGTTLSVLPWAGTAVVSETGVRWPLERFELREGTALGVSNVALGGDVVVTVHEGSALVIVPEAEVLLT